MDNEKKILLLLRHTRPNSPRGSCRKLLSRCSRH